MIYLFDLDGTIVFKGKSIDKRIVRVLKKLEDEGNQVIFASARPIRDMLPLTQESFPHNFLIGGNGSIVQNKDKRVIVQQIPATDFTELKELISKHDLDYLVDSEWDYALKNRDDALAKINSKVDALKLANNVELSSIRESIKCIFLNVPIDLYEKLYEDVSRMKLSVIKHEEGLSIDLTGENINKYTTFRKFFPEDKFIAFGNDENDVEMLVNASRAVVIGENRSIKKLGDVTLPADNQTIAEYLESIQS